MKASLTRIFLLLSRNYGRSVLRSRLLRHHPFLLFSLTLVASGFATLLYLLGRRFHTAVELIGIENPIAFFNDYLVAVIVSLFALRFLFQRTPRFNFNPYLHLPISKLSLIHFFQISSQLTLHNVLPLVFLLPFWTTYVTGTGTPRGVVLWLASLVVLLVVSTLLNNWLRAALAHRRRVISAFTMLLLLFVAVDQLSASFWVNDFSSWYFDSLLAGNTNLFVILLFILAFVFVLSSRSLLLSMRLTHFDRVYNRKLISELPILQNRGILIELITTELRLMWRNRRPRHYLTMSILFSTAYLLFLLANQTMYGGIIFGGVIGLFASGGFALNYGQLMFAWESAYYDGILSRNIDAKSIIISKYLILQGSCIVLYFASLPMFIILRPDLLAIHSAFLIYNAGITSTLIMMLALRNRQRVDVGRTGSFFNYEGFSAVHWVWIFPTALPPILALVVFRNAPTIGTLIVALMGFIGLLTWKLWASSLSREFHQNRYEMAAGFRAA